MSHLSDAIKRCNDYIKEGKTAEERALRRKLCKPSIEEARELDREHKQRKKELKRQEKEIKMQAKEEAKRLKKLSKQAEKMIKSGRKDSVQKKRDSIRIKKQRREHEEIMAQRAAELEHERVMEEQKRRARREMGYAALHPLDLYL